MVGVAVLADVGGHCSCDTSVLNTGAAPDGVPGERLTGAWPAGGGVAGMLEEAVVLKRSVSVTGLPDTSAAEPVIAEGDKGGFTSCTSASGSSVPPTVAA